jgi:hypothetical protein
LARRETDGLRGNKTPADTVLVDQAGVSALIEVGSMNRIV